jgi:hypothetical protein
MSSLFRFLSSLLVSGFAGCGEALIAMPR